MGSLLVTLLQWQNECTLCPHEARLRERAAQQQQQARALPLPRRIADAVLHATYCRRHRTRRHGNGSSNSNAKTAHDGGGSSSGGAAAAQPAHDAGHYGMPYTLPCDDVACRRHRQTAAACTTRNNDDDDDDVVEHAVVRVPHDHTSALSCTAVTHDDDNNSNNDNDNNSDDETAALLMGTMDCVDAYAYTRASKTSAHAAHESAVYCAADTAMRLLAQQPHDNSNSNDAKSMCADASLLLPSRSSSREFVSLASRLQQCCCCPARTQQLAVSWRSVLDTTSQQTATTATTDTAASVVYYLGPRQHLTYGELWSRVHALCVALRALQVRPGDMLVLLDDTRVEWLVTCYAAWRCGAVVVALHDDARCVARAAHDVACDRVRVVVCKHTALRALRRHMTRARRRVLCHSDTDDNDDDDAAAEEVASSRSSAQTHTRACRLRASSQRQRRRGRRLVYLVTTALRTSSNNDDNNNDNNEHGMTAMSDTDGDDDDSDSDVLPWCDAVAHGEAVHAQLGSRDVDADTAARELRDTDLALIAYTEGEPKGVMLTHGALAAALASYRASLTDMHVLPAENNNSNNNSNTADAHATTTTTTTNTAAATTTVWPSVSFRHADEAQPCYLAYMPMHTVRELVLQTVCLLHGVLVCYGAAATLFDNIIDSNSNNNNDNNNNNNSNSGCVRVKPRGDLAEYEPVFFVAAPATLDALCARVQHSLSHGYRRLLFDAAVAARQRARRRGLDTPFLNRVLFAQPRRLLGRRCRVVFATGAPLRPRTRRCVEVVCGVSVVALYSCVECAGCGLTQRAGQDARSDNVGVPHAALALKLRDVLPHWRHDAAWPAGELLLTGPALMCGYYRQPERTADVLERVCVRCPRRCRRRSRRRHSSSSNYGSGNDDDSSSNNDDEDSSSSSSTRLGDSRRRTRCSSSLCGCTAQCAQHEHDGSNGGVCGGSSSNHGCIADAGSSSNSSDENDATHNHNNTSSSSHCTGWWLHTRSIALRERDGTFRIVDGVCTSDVVNACGRRLALELLETMYSSHALSVRDGVCVLAHPFRDYLCALVLTDEARARAFVHTWQQQQQQQQQDDARSDATLCVSWPYCLREPALNAAAARALAAHAAQRGVAPHERVRAVRVLYDDWTSWNGLRTATGRLRRDRIASKYADVIAELFATS